MTDENLTPTRWELVHPEPHPLGPHGPDCLEDPCGRCCLDNLLDAHNRLVGRLQAAGVLA